MIYDVNRVQDKWSRVIIEKPFGNDLQSAIDPCSKIFAQHLDESQIYRIDHYLGKETVQNLLVFRFCNPIFESIWNNRHIDHVQITVSEEIGIGTRGRFWEEAGMLRDIVQNHMMQLLSLVAMEPPSSLKASNIRDEKVKLLEAIRPLPISQMICRLFGDSMGPVLLMGLQCLTTALGKCGARLYCRNICGHGALYRQLEMGWHSFLFEIWQTAS